MDEHKLLRQRERAARAKSLIETEAFTEALKEIDSRLIEQFRKEADPSVRDALWQAMQLFDEIPRILKNTMSKGRMAESDLAKLTELKMPRAA